MTTSNNKVSVIMPTYNSGTTIAQSIESVLNQTLSEFELLIVDDKSNDDTIDLIQRYEAQDSRIKLVIKESNSGVAEARNVGILAATGEYITFLDSDDLWAPNKLQVQYDFMEKRRLQFTFMNYEIINVENHVVGYRTSPYAVIEYKQMLRGNQIGMLTVMLDSEIMKKHLMRTIGHEDYVAWLEIVKSGVHAVLLYTEKPLASYRVHESLSSNKFEAFKWTWKIYREVEQLSVKQSVISMYYYVINRFLRKE